MEFRIAKAAAKTGAMLEAGVRELLKKRGVKEPNCVVCYGAGYSGKLPAINSACNGGTKLQQAVQLEKDLPLGEALEVFTEKQATHPNTLSEIDVEPLIARKVKHSKGKDILVCRTAKQVYNALNKDREYFTKLVASDTEYRVWVYRKRVLTVYEKRLTEPKKNTGFGRNRRHGWTFHRLPSEQIPEAIRRVSIAAVAALGLDFGAVDVLGKWIDRDHTNVTPTVLEVNTAPGVSDEHRSAIVKLVNRVSKWAEKGCPARV